MKFDLPHLPIHAVITKLKKNLADHKSVILSAEPGSGKTTIVPLTLLNEPWLKDKKIILLEPRRIAARMSAKRMSELAGDRIGGLIGYRIRFDTKISSKTRIEVVTEGVFTRMIQQDPELTDVGLVIFDEYHVRSIQADLGLALCIDILEIRDDLKLMIMSATMDSSRVSQLLNGAPVVSGQGSCFPVSNKYLPRPSQKSLIQLVVTTIHRVLKEQKGDILVFLPGAGEIKAVKRQVTGDFICLTLYGNLPKQKQDLVFVKAEQRRLILATPIAETSLTIEGVSVVIDSGLMKIPHFSPNTGLTTLQTVTISKASADQRTGRAGRLGPGVCFRLWTKGEHHSKAEFIAPEIVGADLSPLLLQILQWGVNDTSALCWLDPPRQGQVKQSRKLLIQLGAMDKEGSLTKRGREIATLPLHPRLALMLLIGRKNNNGPLACQLAALLQNRDLFRANEKIQTIDIEDRLEILQLFAQKGSSPVRAKGADPALCRTILKEANQYQRITGISGRVEKFHESGNLLAFAYPDRIAQRKPGSNQHLLSSGRGVILPIADHLQHTDFLVAAHLDGGKRQGRVFIGAALNHEEIISNHAHLLAKKELIFWNRTQVEAHSILTLGKLELSRKPLPKPNPEKVTQSLLKGIRQTGIDCLNWQKKSRALQDRINSAHTWDPENWPDLTDINLIRDLSWLEPYLDSITTLKQLKKLDLYSILISHLSWQKQQKLEKLLPIHYQVPSGSRIRLKYKPGDSPVLAVRLQEMFGATDTPAIFGGKIPIIVHLLSPAGRPIQVTQDLAGFWQRTYKEVKKELKGRYPKHFWPENPLTATATKRVQQRKF